MAEEKFRSRVYTDRPAYADEDSPEKFMTILGIMGTRLRQHPNAVCSYSGGSDSDIMLDLLETARRWFDLPPIDYVFINTGLEMSATKRHVKEVSEKYGITITECRPKKGIVRAVREHGIPFMSKIFSQDIGIIQEHNLPMEIKEEFDSAEDKEAKLFELYERYPNNKQPIRFLCSCNSKGEPFRSQNSICSAKYLYEFMREYPPQFKISAKCCDYCKKQVAHELAQKYEMVITGERFAEGGLRSQGRHNTCFEESSFGKYKFKPIYYVSDKDKAWYKSYANIRYSDAYEVYGMKRTGCCGCPINSRVLRELEIIGIFEPNIAKAAWNVFGESYRYRQQYRQYLAEQKKIVKNPGQISLFD